MKNKAKNFNTVALLLAFCFGPNLPAHAIKSQAAANTHCSFLINAPDQHVVVKGDTLWGISLKFLEHAWCWPNVWNMNREDIKNPHWIYPGQIVYFDRAAGRLRLGQSVGNEGIPNVRLSPHIRRENLDEAISTIPAKAIEPFLSQPVVFEADELAHAPHVVAANRSHLISGSSDKAYVSGDLMGATEFQVYRPSTPLIDPGTKQLLGYEHTYVGTVQLVKTANAPDQAHTFLVTKAKEEVSEGDRLLPMPAANYMNYVPHPPSNDVQGQVISVYGGVALAGQHQTVTINRGVDAGIDVGTVLTLYRTGREVVDKVQNNQVVYLPDEEYGTLFVYRVFNNVAYGLVMNVSEGTRVGDTVKSPQ